MKTTQAEFLRLAAVKTRYGVSPSTIWHWTKSQSNGFPKPIKLGANTTAWRLSDLLVWEQNRPSAE